RELVPDTSGDHHQVAEVAEVVRVQVHARVPLLHLPAEADAAAELDVVRAAGRAAAGDARHQIEHANLGGPEDALVIRHQVVLRAEQHGDRVHVHVRAGNRALVELVVEPDAGRGGQLLDDRVLRGQQHAAANAVHVSVV